jgi:hypothetical protein
MRERGFEEQLSRVVVASNKAKNGRRFSLHPFERKIFVFSVHTAATIC